MPSQALKDRNVKQDRERRSTCICEAPPRLQMTNPRLYPETEIGRLSTVQGLSNEGKGVKASKGVYRVFFFSKKRIKGLGKNGQFGLSALSERGLHHVISRSALLEATEAQNSEKVRGKRSGAELETVSLRNLWRGNVRSYFHSSG